MSLVGIDPEIMKRRLSIKALEFRSSEYFTLKYVFREHKMGDRRSPGLGGLRRGNWIQHWTMMQSSGYYDPETGMQG